LGVHQMFQKTIEELMQFSRYRLKDYIKGQRAMKLALSSFSLSCPPVRITTAILAVIYLFSMSLI
ncbi:MAG: hypothetical protein ACKO3K_03720, partial [Cuspidothrix sp.]